MPYSWPVTLAEAKTHLNIVASTDDTELQGFIDAATEVVENIVGPVTPTSYTEWHDGGQETILLSRYPVTAITSVAEYTPTAQVIAAEPTDGGTFTGYGYTYDPDQGVITRTASGVVSRFTPGRVKVVYTAGRAEVPASIRMAALVLIEHMWETQRGGQGPEAPLGLDETAFAPSAGYLIPNRVTELLAPYRKAPAVA